MIKSQITNPKIQINLKTQISKVKTFAISNLKYWNLFGICNLEFGAWREAGFTLIELLIVFSVMVILSSVGIASFVVYSHSQSVDIEMKNFKQELYTARSRALSQLRDSTCFSGGFNGTNYTLEGYQVVLCCSFPLCQSMSCNDNTNNYELQAVYSNSQGNGITYETCNSHKFSDPTISVSASSTTATYFFFSTITGAVTTNAANIPKVTFSAYGITKVASVSATGVIQ